MLIRQYKNDDLDAVMSSWENACALAHPFLSDEFQAKVRKDIPEMYIPNSDVWVVEWETDVVGFIALIGNEVGAIFLQPSHHGRKLGKLMMDKAKDLHGELEVEVFEKNTIGRKFYDCYGFELMEKKDHPESGEKVHRLKFVPRQK